MGPNRTIYERRFFLTEPAFDEATGRFYERPLGQPQPVAPCLEATEADSGLESPIQSDRRAV